LTLFSKQFRPAERKYSAFNHEFLALYLVLRHFHYFLEGHNFIAFTDHEPLLLPLLRFQTSGLLGSSDTSLQYPSIPLLSGTLLNTVADAVSRISINTAHQLEPGVDFSAMAAAQGSNPEIAAYRTAISGLVLQDVQFGPSGTTPSFVTLPQGTPDQ